LADLEKAVGHPAQKKTNSTFLEYRGAVEPNQLGLGMMPKEQCLRVQIIVSDCHIIFHLLQILLPKSAYYDIQQKTWKINRSSAQIPRSN
jgi:hypothetical protein